MITSRLLCPAAMLVALSAVSIAQAGDRPFEIASPAPFHVFQRDGDTGTIICRGTFTGRGVVRARVLKDGKPLPGLDWREVGPVQNGQWSGKITGVPTGGPYVVEIDLAQSTTVPVENVLVGDIWLLAGQSNMQGVGDMVNVEAPHPLVHTFETRYQWAVAEEPLHRLLESPNPVHHLLMNPKATPEDIERNRKAPRKPVAKGTGLGLPFAKELVRRQNIPIGLVPCAHGGTSMQQWDPAKKSEGGRSLYGQMLDRFHAVGGKVRGVLWYQGESDASADRQPKYRETMKHFIATVREDFGDPELPFYLVQISRVTTMRFDPLPWAGVREDQRLLEREVPNVRTVSAIDLELDDLIHIGTEGLKVLGQRMAKIADRHVYGNRELRDGPRLKSVRLEKPGVIRVTFDEVNGRLAPSMHIAGFSLRDEKGVEGPDFFDVKVDPERPDSLLCQYHGTLEDNLSLWYGFGLNPYCNLTDSENMGVCAFGPIQIERPGSQPAK